MIRKIILILCLICGAILYAQNVQRIKYKHMYENNDGTRNWYIIDTLKFDRAKLYLDKFNHVYLINDTTTNFLISKSVFRESNVFMVLEDNLTGWFNYMSFSEIEKIESFIPETYMISPNFESRNKIILQEYSNNKYSRFIYSRPPIGYLYLLMTGNAYNQLTYYGIMDGSISKPLKFPDASSYYRVLMPIWEEPFEDQVTGLLVYNDPNVSAVYGNGYQDLLMDIVSAISDKNQKFDSDGLIRKISIDFIVTACGKICGVRVPGKKFEELSRFERYLVKYIEEHMTEKWIPGTINGQNINQFYRIRVVI